MAPELEAALVGAIVGAVLGVLGTYVFDVRKSAAQRVERDNAQARDRRRHRETVATALLQDLRRLEFELREVFGEERPTRIALSRPSLLYDVLRQEIRFFSATSVQPVAEFFRRVDHLYAGVQALRAASGGAIQSTPQREYELRSHAAFALQALPQAVAALRNEGGIVPGPIDWSAVTFPTLPTVPPPSFDDTSARLADQSSGHRGI